MNFLLQCLIVLFLLILSVPLHELGHLLTFKLIGSQTKFRAKWLIFNRKRWTLGRIEPADGTDYIHIPDFWGTYYKIPCFLALILGGWGVTFLFLWLRIMAPISSQDFSLWRTPLLIVSTLHFIYGLREAIRGIMNMKVKIESV
mgnify:CR=1 FL=1